MASTLVGTQQPLEGLAEPAGAVVPLVYVKGQPLEPMDTQTGLRDYYRELRDGYGYGHALALRFALRRARSVRAAKRAAEGVRYGSPRG